MKKFCWTRRRASIALAASLAFAGPALAQSPVATLVVRDLLTGRIQRIPLQSAAMPNGNVRWSTGDMVSPEGQVVTFRLGQRVFGRMEGTLWSVPVQAASSGEARIGSPVGRVAGTMRWKAVPDADGEPGIEAEVRLDTAGGVFMPQNAASGSFKARYEGAVPVPVVARTELRGSAQGGPGSDRSESKLEWPAPEASMDDPELQRASQAATDANAAPDTSLPDAK